jgi:TonB-dependent SusC/RagA subfamily outer membrane receptor
MKNANVKLILTVLLSCSIACYASGQQKAKKRSNDLNYEPSDLVKIEGTVTAFNNYFVKNAEITSKNTKAVAMTDSDGSYEITATKGDVLIFTANGFEKNRRKVRVENDDVDVNMILKPGELNQEIAVGYGHLNAAELTHALVHYGDLNNDYLKYTDMRDLLQREIPGARVTDWGGTKVYIRGGENLSGNGFGENAGAAIFVVDGTITPTIDYLQPRDVKSLTMLKGSGAAIYGARGTNGVVLIATR